MNLCLQKFGGSTDEDSIKLQPILKKAIIFFKANQI
jgi:hypothetical protein